MSRIDIKQNDHHKFCGSQKTYFISENLEDIVVPKALKALVVA